LQVQANGRTSSNIHLKLESLFKDKMNKSR
jgi:hypothetical protein